MTDYFFYTGNILFVHRSSYLSFPVPFSKRERSIKNESDARFKNSNFYLILFFMAFKFFTKHEGISH